MTNKRESGNNRPTPKSTSRGMDKGSSCHCTHTGSSAGHKQEEEETFNLQHFQDALSHSKKKITSSTNSHYEVNQCPGEDEDEDLEDDDDFDEDDDFEDDDDDYDDDDNFEEEDDEEDREEEESSRGHTPSNHASKNGQQRLVSDKTYQQRYENRESVYRPTHPSHQKAADQKSGEGSAHQAYQKTQQPPKKK